MFEHFFMSMQQDIKLFLLFPIISAVFRLTFILAYHPGSLKGKGRVIFECFRFGFWWGMDFNAYLFLIPLVIISLPSMFWNIFTAYGDMMRVGIGTVYGVVLYAAFMGKLIFYRHFHDTYNYLVHMGKHAEKHNLIDVFFSSRPWISRFVRIYPFYSGISRCLLGHTAAAFRCVSSI